MQCEDDTSSDIFATQVEEESSEDTVAAASNILDVTQDIGRSVASTLGRYCVDIFSENITLVWVNVNITQWLSIGLSLPHVILI